MSRIDKTFKQICSAILREGVEYENKRRGVKRLQVPSVAFSHPFSEGFPALSLKQLYFKSVVTELLWFLRGDNNIKFLKDNGCSIWDQDAYNWFKKINPEAEDSFEEFVKVGYGSVGRNYSSQWRDYNRNTDQIKDLIENMEKDIFSSRLIVNAWNPSEINQTALPPCHSWFQIIGDLDENGNEGFWLLFNMRSWDFFLGASFNIASYALLAKILEKITGYKAFGIICHAACVHFYDNQYESAREVITRDDEKHENCSVILPDVKREEGMSSFKYFEYFLDSVSPSDFKLEGYSYDSPIKVQMLSPKKI